MKNIELSEWFIVEGFCATRVIKGTNVDDDIVANRIAFIGKHGKVRISEYTDEDSDNKKWKTVYRGSGSSDPKLYETNGYDLETRSEVDKILIEMGYILS